MNRNLIYAVTICIVAFLIIAFMLKVNVVAKWFTRAEGENWGLDIDGKTEIIGRDGLPIRMAFFAKMSSLAFFVGSQEVVAMRVTLTWTASGEGVDWTTLQITISADGTGGYTKSFKSTLKTGSTIFDLPITTDQLGRIPTQGEEVSWKMTINVQGTVKDLVGRSLTATAQPIICEAKTKWVEASFTVEGSASTTTSSGTSTGGCPGGHYIWVYNVADTGVKYELFGYALVGLILVDTALIAYSLKRKNPSPPQ